MHIPNCTSDYSLQKALNRQRATPIADLSAHEFKPFYERIICLTSIKHPIAINDSELAAIEANIENAVVILMDEGAHAYRTSVKELTIQFEFPGYPSAFKVFNQMLDLKGLAQDFEVTQTFKVYALPQIALPPTG